MKDHDLVQWFRQMAVLIDCGIPTTRALEACGRQTSCQRLRGASQSILKELRVGQRMSQAMRLAGPPFDLLHCGAVEVGERQGDLALVFDRLATHSEQVARVKRRLQSALAYPALVVVFSLLGLYLLIRFLSPVLVDVARQLGQEPSTLSQIMLALGRLFEQEMLTLALGLLLFWTIRGLLRYLWRSQRKRTERLLFRLPLVGKMLRLSALIRVCQTLETMIGAGLPLTESMTLAGRGCGSLFYAEDVFAPAVDRVRQGESVRSSLRGAPGLPSSFSGLILAGEESGRLEESFGHLSRLFEMELVSAVETFLAALEPLAIVAVGSVVMVVLLSVFVPLSKLIATV